MIEVDPKQMTSYWSARNLTDAKRKIYSEYDGKTWDGQTRDVLPILLSDAVLRSLDELEEPRTSLEIGCGVGRLMKALIPLPYFQIVSGIDMTPSMVALSGEYLKGHEETKAVIVMPCDGESIPVQQCKVDFVYSMIVFQHIPSRQAIQSYIRETERVLKPGGVCRIQTFKGIAPEVPTPIEGHYYRSAVEFAREFEAVGLNVLEAQEGVWHEQHIWVTARKPTCAF